ncbi:MAG: cytidylyltransferase domain-containing protein [archaeon]
MQLGIFIPGRLASERLPNKLILPLGESCLWEMACKKLNKLPNKYNKYALCYDQELIDIAKKYPNIKIIERSKKTAHVDGPLTYIFKELQEVEDTHLMFLNPCLSFLTKETIINSLEQFNKMGKDYATSVKKYQNWLFTKDVKCLTKINYERLTTKEIPTYYEAAHCFHIFNKNLFFQNGQMLVRDHGIIEIPKEETIDVDTVQDYEFARWKHSKKYVIDIDNTICYNNSSNTLDYNKAKPIKENIKKVNHLYNAGNIIWFYTARGTETGIDWEEVTKNQLKEWKVKYHKLLFGKPSADVYVDDKALNIKDW